MQLWPLLQQYFPAWLCRRGCCDAHHTGQASACKWCKQAATPLSTVCGAQWQRWSSKLLCSREPRAAT
jgi:hypothetical protein